MTNKTFYTRVSIHILIFVATISLCLFILDRVFDAIQQKRENIVLEENNDIKAMQYAIKDIFQMLDVRICGDNAHFYSERLFKIDGSYGIKKDSIAYLYTQSWCTRNKENQKIKFEINK